jgi:hypothetical protein
MASLAKLLITPTFGTLALYPKDSIMSLAIVTAADSGFFGYLFGMLRSVRDKPQGASAALCVLDDGFSESQRDALFIQGASVRRLEWPYLRSLTTDARICLSKCQSPEYFPGYDTYMWIDADAWVQSWDAIDAYCAGAEECGFCIAPEWHPSYSLTHFWGIEFAKGWFGPPAPGTRDIPINAGVFAGRADAPHSKAWRKRIADVVERPPFNPIAHFALDQAALNAVIDRDHLPCDYAPVTNNFLCNHGRPKISEDGTLLLDPYPRYRPLGIVHNAGKEKARLAMLQTPSGELLTRGFTYASRSVLPVGDYISPGLTVTLLDQCFPSMIKADTATFPWPHFRRDIHHPLYVDKRRPLMAFLTRDEAHILYNTALRFRNKQALAIGCDGGWSACHLAIAGLDLDIIDPNFANQQFREDVITSLNLAMPPNRVQLHALKTPDAVKRIADERSKRWSLFFIDGNHDHPFPLNDAIVCEQHAEPDAMILFHYLTAPSVAEGLSYLRQRNWNVRIYHTAQIMGVAWRGGLSPVHHQPDRSVAWRIPDHLRQFI